MKKEGIGDQRWDTMCSTMKSKNESLRYCFLPLERKGKRFVQKNPHTEVSKLQFREMIALAKDSFEKTKSITYERYKLFTKTQEAGESLESFHAALTAQAVKAELGTLEDDLF